MISEEVRMLNRDTSSLGPSKPSNDSADFAVGPAPIGQDAPAGRMGENMPPEREGPLAQGTGRPVRSYDDIDVGGGTQQVRETRTPDSAIEEPTEGGASLLEQDAASVSVNRAQDLREDTASDVERQAGVVTRRSQAAASAPAAPGQRLPLPGTPFQPPTPSIEELTLSGTNSSTIAAASFEGTMNDRIRTIAEPGQGSAHRNNHCLAQKVLNRQIVKFKSPEEKQAVINECRRITGRGAKMTDQQRAAKGPDDHPYFTPLPEHARKMLVDKMVNGVYDGEGLLSGAQKHKQPVLNEIARVTMKNGTYLGSDGDRLLKKVRSLLPAMQATQQQRGGQRQEQQASK